jgi:Glycosyltransferase family 87/WD40-like Beta Propeller Repeat
LALLRRVAVWPAVISIAILFLSTSFRKGWTDVATDFPNYYTAAVLARRHEPLPRYYDWTWFQRQMNYTGTETQLGGYIPQTPLTMLPFIPLSGLAPQHAKQFWLALNLIFLGISTVLIARLTNKSAEIILLIAFAGYMSLATNFLLGQYYVFVLLFLTLGVWCLIRGRTLVGGFCLGVICMLKLYSAPFFLYFLWKRQWRTLLGMLAACIGLGMLSITWFGWDANVYYVTSVFSRASENAILDPYHPTTGTFTNLLRRTLVMEPELNPHPLFEAPFVFFFLRPFLTLAVLVIPLLALSRSAAFEKGAMAWFVIAILLSSPNTALYVFIVLLLPLSLLLAEASRWRTVALIAVYSLLCLPLFAAWSWLFPKVWLLVLLYIMAGRGYWRNLRIRRSVAAFLLIAAISFLDAWRHQQSWNQEPRTTFESVASQAGSIYASSPAVSRTGIVFESLGAGGYTLNRSMAFEGHAFHPSVPASGSPIFFELVAKGHSRIMSFDPATHVLEGLTSEEMDATGAAISKNGDRLAFISRGKLFVRGDGVLPTPGPVRDAAWFPDGTHLAFSVNGVIYDSKDMQPIKSGVAGDQSEPAVSPDGYWLALTATHRGIRHIWLANISTGAARELTAGACNSYAPAWEQDSSALIFASDCGRGLGLPRLYRAVL